MSACRGLDCKGLGAVAVQLGEVDSITAQGERTGYAVEGNSGISFQRNSLYRAVAVDVITQLVRRDFLVVSHDGIAGAEVEAGFARTFAVEENAVVAEVLSNIYTVFIDSRTVLSEFVAVRRGEAVEGKYCAVREAVEFAGSDRDCRAVKGDVACRPAADVNCAGGGGIEREGSILLVVGEGLSVGFVAIDACAFALVNAVVAQRGSGLNVGGFRHTFSKTEGVSCAAEFERARLTVKRAKVAECSRGYVDSFAVRRNVDSRSNAGVVVELQGAVAGEVDRLLVAVVGYLLVVFKLVARSGCALRFKLAGIIIEACTGAYALSRRQVGAHCQLVAGHIGSKAEGCAAVNVGGESVFADSDSFVVG